VTSFLTRATAAIDQTVVRFMERKMTARPRHRDPVAGQGDPRLRLGELARAYNDTSRPFFAVPEVPEVRATARGEHCFDLAFDSAYVPFHPDAHDFHGRIRENHTAHARWWVAEGERRPTIVMIHGWGGGHHWMTARSFVVPYWLRHGFDVATFVLPFHGARAPDASGALFPSPNPLRTNEGFGQAIHDLRAFARWLRERGAPAVGAMGMSLGGYTTALWASLAGRQPAAGAADEGGRDGAGGGRVAAGSVTTDPGGLDFAVALIPAVSMSRLMWRHGETSPLHKRAVTAGITEELLAEAFAVHAPLARPVRLPPERLAVIAGRGDRITPPDHAEALARHWGVEVAWFDGGHLAQIGRAEPLRAVRRQLASLS
jgi:pimeloyl-ACP methyl ester carboxylesterase